MKNISNIITYLLLLLTTGLCQAEVFVTKSINLNYRQAEDVVSLLRPFLHPDGAITADGYRILVKTSPNNYQDLLQLVAEIDVSMRQLRISVTIDNDLVAQENNPLTNNLDDADEHNKTVSKLYTTEKKNRPGTTQHVNVTEGKWANISSGESIPVGQRTRNPDGTITESITYKSIDNSIQILPRINGKNVTLFIRPQISTRTGAAGRSHSQSAETTLTGKLNQWIPIGGTFSIDVNQPGSRLYSTQGRENSEKQMFVKVEILQ